SRANILAVVTTGRAEQTRQPTSALSLVRGSSPRRRPRSRLEAFLPAQAVPEGIGESEGRRSSQTRDPAVDHVARPDQLRRILSPRPNAAEKRWCPCGDARSGS